MAQQLKLEVGKKYLTRDGRVVEVVSVTSLTYPYRGILVDSGWPASWLADGSYIGYGETDDLDLVSEYVETPAAPVAFRYFTLENNDRSLQFFCIWRAADGDPDHVEASCPNNPGDTWTRTGHTLEELTDPAGYFVECDENGVPLSPPPAPEPRIPEGFIEVTRVYNIFNKDYLTKVLLRVSDIASVHEGAERCTIKTVSGTHDYSVSESYTTVLEKINAALP